MASTYSAQDAITYAKRFVGRIPLDDSELKLRLLQDAADRFHTYFPWSWTLGTLDAISINNDQQEYTFTDPNDFFYILKGEIRQPAQTETVKLRPAHSIPLSNEKGNPNLISKASATTLRLSPTPDGYQDNASLYVWYKKKNNVLDAGNVTTASTLLFPDEWFWVFQEIVLAKAFEFENTGRAGNVQVQDNKITYTGQLAKAQAALMEMARREKPLLEDLGIQVTEG